MKAVYSKKKKFWFAAIATTTRAQQQAMEEAEKKARTKGERSEFIPAIGFGGLIWRAAARRAAAAAAAAPVCRDSFAGNERENTTADCARRDARPTTAQMRDSVGTTAAQRQQP